MHGADDESLSAEPEYAIARPAVTLVVRAWLEPVADAAPVLRGTVSKLGGAMLGAFNSIGSLAALVDRHLNPTTPEKSSNTSQSNTSQ